ncbi:hypothetical protein GCM10009623_16710 [Nocardioides aestuarii]|uniref:CPBP family intramembrane metalloprotease n=1 Tax=Nocardioides aestuarii TaxID=252231 RepID=A0ABW4TM81_9ACTN
MPMVVHGLWDFGTISGQMSDEIYVGSALFILADVVLAVVAIATLRKVFPRNKGRRVAGV